MMTAVRNGPRGTLAAEEEAPGPSSCSRDAARIARLRAQGRSWPQITDELGCKRGLGVQRIWRFQKTLSFAWSLRTDSALLAAAHLPFRKH